MAPGKSRGIWSRFAIKSENFQKFSNNAYRWKTSATSNPTRYKQSGDLKI